MLTSINFLLGGGVLGGSMQAPWSALTLFSQYELFSLPGLVMRQETLQLTLHINNIHLVHGLLLIWVESFLLVSSHFLSQLPSLLLKLWLLYNQSNTSQLLFKNVSTLIVPSPALPSSLSLSVDLAREFLLSLREPGWLSSLNKGWLLILKFAQNEEKLFNV